MSVRLVRDTGDSHEINYAIIEDMEDGLLQNRYFSTKLGSGRSKKSAMAQAM
jgi:hypothetical protein